MSGYLQVSLTEKVKLTTASRTPDDTAEFEEKPCGLTNAPYEFSRLMSICLEPLREKMISNYFDNVLMPAANEGQMWEHCS